MKSRGVLVSVWLTLFVGTAADAETAVYPSSIAPQSRIFKATLARPQLETLFLAGRRQDVALHLQMNCAEQIQVHPLQLILLKTIELPDDQVNPVSGSWQVKYDLIRCGESKRYNVIFAADPRGGKPNIIAEFPGDSIAGLQLIRDAMPMTAGLANAKAGDGRCQKLEQVLTADMQVEETPHRVVEGDHVYENVWTETWTFDVCGHPITATMRFVPNAHDGGTDWTARFPQDKRASVPSEP